LRHTLITALLLAVTVIAGSVPLRADPNDDAKRVERYHTRLLTIGSGSATSIWVFLRDGESLKGNIDYLNATEVGVRDEFGHLRPVPLKGIMQFTAQNRATHVKTASSSVWHRAALQIWLHMNGVNFAGFAPSLSAFRLL
jgi:hypothetical protein